MTNHTHLRHPQGRERRETIVPPGLQISNDLLDIDIVTQAVSYEYKLTNGQIYEKNRKREIVDARNMALYFLTIDKSKSLNEIGAQYGKDHCTVLNARSVIEGFFKIYPEVSEKIFKVVETIEWLNQLQIEIEMSEIPTSRIRYMYFLLDQLGIRWMKEDLVMDASSGRTSSVRDLIKLEMDGLIKHLEQKLKDAQEQGLKNQSMVRMDRMRKRILSICYTLGWTTIDPEKNRHVVDQERLGTWLYKYSYLHKELNDYTYLELPTLVTQFEKLLKSTLSTYKQH